MKKIRLGLSLVLLSAYAHAQGLENIIVEKYYISNAADAAGSIGALPEGSVTYRVYVDMLPGYKFQAAFGNPSHLLKINTTTTFFNNQDRGATTPIYTKNQAAGNTIMLDSWLSVGAACANNFGILKSEDNATGGTNVVNSNGILQNQDPAAGIPLTARDGLYSGTPQAVQVVGISAASIEVFNATSQVGNSFTTSNGSWAALNGAQGPVPATNRVLIAQMTTNGVFSFELNIQLGTPAGGVEKYVARNPTGSEIQNSKLIYPSVLNVKAFIQGYYTGGSQMTPVLSNQSIPGATPDQVDTVEITLHDPADFSIVESYKGIINTSGNISCLFSGSVIGNSYYVSFKHRNALFTVSTNPVLINEITNYNFSSSASAAMGDNQVDAFGDGVWSVYSGDVSQDEYIATDDVTLVDNDNLAGLSADYLTTDVGGDGYCGTDDVTIVDNNNLLGVFSIHP